MSRSGGEEKSGGTEDGGWKHISIDDVELGDVIGGGGAGVIYMGWYHDKPVALKTLFDPRVDENLKQEYLDELLVMSKLNHSNIVTFMGACMTSPKLFFMMELCEGSLYNFLHVDRVNFSEREKMRIIIDVASAMEYLHSLKPSIVHRDLKSLNVLRSYDGYYKICDFGLVKNKNANAGTPAYMAPELLRNKPYNKSVDVFSFAVLVWEVMNGQVPHNFSDVTSIHDKVVSGQRLPLPLPQGGSRLSRLVSECWSQNSEDRPTFVEVMDSLLDIDDNLVESKHADSVSDSLEGLIRK